MPKQQIFTVREHINLLSSTSSAILNQLWLPKLVKQVTDFAWCQREFLLLLNFNRSKLQKKFAIWEIQTVIESS